MTSKEWKYLEWDQEKISRLWNFASQWPPYQNEYFSRMVGAGIINFLKKIVPLQGDVLDYGCGPGFLVQHLLARGIRCAGVDFSEDSINAVNARFSENPLWKGAKLYTGGKLPFEDDSFDKILCIETIEHLNDEDLDRILKEFHRVLKPKTGQLFITTPNHENLSTNMVFCPHCMQVFHRFQHIHSFSQGSLVELMETKKFSTELCNTTTFNFFQQDLLTQVTGSIKGMLNSVCNRREIRLKSFPDNRITRKGGFLIEHQIGRGPHLFWLGKKEP
jgi:2-polyprenyl-3-methyl-5-hydroxy-6-metoxy-1,4-benzoquinol methylase